MWKVIPCNFKKGDDININDNKRIWAYLIKPEEQDYGEYEYQSNDDYIKYSNLIDQVIEKSYIDFEKIYDWKEISESILQDIMLQLNSFNNSIVSIVSQYEENYDFDEISLTPNYILSLLKSEQIKVSRKIKSIIIWISLVQ